MTHKIMVAIITVATVALLVGSALVVGSMFLNYSRILSERLEDELVIASQGVELLGLEFLEAIGSEDVDTKNYRFTWISDSGQVLFDNESNLAYEENHMNRPEIVQAYKYGKGSDTRYSSTLLEVTVYHAMRLSNGSVLRVSESRATMIKVVIIMLLPFMAVLVVLWCFSFFYARRMSQKIVEPLNSIDLDNPLDNDVYPELSPLLKRIYVQRQEIDKQLIALRHSADEFSQIARSMSEGLIVLDASGKVLTMNDAAIALFDLKKSYVGHNFLEVCRIHDFSFAVKKALELGHEEIRLSYEGRVIRFSMSRMESQGTVLGLVIIAFDITNYAEAEDMRREFSANVSHELKTPLQGIMGSAEIIEIGFAQGDDVKRFASNIRKEASRMVNLIEDIMRLSQLDEGSSLPFEDINLTVLALTVKEELIATANSKGVRIEFVEESLSSPPPVYMNGVYRLIHEMLYNLVDNGIKYNNAGGRVYVKVYSEKGSAVIEVLDTGIGIPQEHLSRIFERFYRVEKSHSKASGGTGLGLSIVKHVVLYHGGKISVESTVGEGSKFIVTLPRSKTALT